LYLKIFIFSAEFSKTFVITSATPANPYPCRSFWDST